MSTELLARLQFAFTISFHQLYPPLSIELGLLLVTLGIMPTIALIGLPVVLAHSASIYWNFRGKVRLDKTSCGKRRGPAETALINRRLTLFKRLLE